MNARPASARFPTTAWSCIEKASDRRHPDFVAAMNRLITSYWRPVFHFLRAQGQPAARAEDLVQEFFLRFLARDWLKPADPARGRFRSFLLTILKRFVHDQTADARRQDKFEEQFVSVHSLLREEDRAWEPPAGETPDQLFEKQWKLDTRAAVRCNFKAFYDGLDRTRDYQVFAAYYFVDRSQDRPTQEELAVLFGIMRDPVRDILKEGEKRYARLCRQELRDQGFREDELDQELRNLL